MAPVYYPLMLKKSGIGPNIRTGNAGMELKVNSLEYDVNVDRETKIIMPAEK